MTTDQKIIKNKIGLLKLAEELGNVSRACKVMGFSRDTFYRYRELSHEGGLDALVEKTKRKPNIKNRVSEDMEEAILALAGEVAATRWWRRPSASPTSRTASLRTWKKPSWPWRLSSLLWVRFEWPMNC